MSESGEHQSEERSQNDMSKSTKGILRQGFSDPTLWPQNQTEVIEQTFSQPIFRDSNNTTSRLNVVGIQNKANRRVSFAPDVTLHSFDFVPRSITNNNNNNAQEDTSAMELTQPISKGIEFQKSHGEHENESMDMTQVYDNNNRERSDINEDESMDITIRQERLSPILFPLKSTQNSKMMDLTQPVRKSDTKTISEPSSDQPYEEPMELTEIVTIPEIDKLIPAENMNKSNRSFTQFFPESQSMDFTQIQNHDRNKDVEETMDITSIQNPAILSNTNNSSTGSKSSKEITKIDTLQSGSKILQPSNIPRIVRKRRRLDEPIVPVSSMEGYTQSKPPHSGTQDQDIENMERMSPVRIEEFNEFNQESSETLQDPKQNISLKTFIADTNIGFLTDLNILKQEIEIVSFPTVSLSQEYFFKIQKLYDSLYNDIPIIQMNVFIIKELMSISSQSTKSFENLDKQIRESSNHPLLLSDYFSSDAKTKERIIEQLQLVKSFSKLNARKSFSEWYLSQLKNLKSVLIENKSLLGEEYQKVKNTSEHIISIHDKVNKIKDLLKKELSILESTQYNTDEEFNLRQKIRVTWLKRELEKYKVSVESLSELQEKEIQINNEISNNCSKLENLKKDMMMMTEINNASGISEIEIEKLFDDIQILQNITGINFTKFDGSIISLDVIGASRIAIEIDLNKNTSDIISLSSNQSHNPLIVRLIDKFAKDFKVRKGTKSMETVVQLILKVRDISRIIREYELLDVLFPMEINDADIIQVHDCNLVLNDEILYELSITEFIRGASSDVGQVKFTAQILKGQPIEVPDIIARFSKKTARILPWLNEERIHITMK